jgi:predicted RNase H-like HicB family nuclease
MKYLVIVRQSGGVYHARVPRLPGCAAQGATVEEAAARIEAVIRAHLATTPEAANGAVEVVVAEDVWQERRKGDGLDDVYNQMARDFNVLDLEQFFDLDEEKLIPFEDVIREFETLEQQGPPDGAVA